DTRRFCFTAQQRHDCRTVSRGRRWQPKEIDDSGCDVDEPYHRFDDEAARDVVWPSHDQRHMDEFVVHRMPMLDAAMFPELLAVIGCADDESRVAKSEIVEGVEYLSD